MLFLFFAVNVCCYPHEYPHDTEISQLVPLTGFYCLVEEGLGNPPIYMLE